MANYGDAFGKSIYPASSSDPSNYYRPHRYDITIDKAKASGDTIPAIVIIDSAQRNRDMYENPGQYTVELPKVYTDVTSIQLMQANVPHSSYTISPRNNLVTFRFNDADANIALTAVPVTTVTLPTGNYTASTLATELQTVINEVNLFRDQPGTTFAVTYDSIIQRFRIVGPAKRQDGTTQSHKSFQFIAGVKGGIDAILGLGRNTVTSSSNGTYGDVIVMPGNAVMSPDRYIVLNIEGMNRCDGNNSVLANSFCIIPVDSSTAEGDFTLKNGDTIDNDTYIHYYTEPLPKLAKLKITFYAPDGSIYDFNGRDHFLVFEITCMTRPTKL
jgi:hypothetical protein